MQRTRLSILTSTLTNRLETLFSNPWRWFALMTMSLFFGIFIGEAISTTTGQTATWDIVAAAWMVLFTEVVSRWAYRLPQLSKDRRSLWLNALNVFKIGVVYSLYLEAFKLGS